MKQILHSDWLPEWTSSLCDQVCLVKVAEYWPHSFFVFFFYQDEETQKRMLAQNPAILASHLVNNAYPLEFLVWARK